MCVRPYVKEGRQEQARVDMGTGRGFRDELLRREVDNAAASFLPAQDLDDYVAYVRRVSGAI